MSCIIKYFQLYLRTESYTDHLSYTHCVLAYLCPNADPFTSVRSSTGPSESEAGGKVLPGGNQRFQAQLEGHMRCFLLLLDASCLWMMMMMMMMRLFQAHLPPTIFSHYTTQLQPWQKRTTTPKVQTTRKMRITWMMGSIRTWRTINDCLSPIISKGEPKKQRCLDSRKMVKLEVDLKK